MPVQSCEIEGQTGFRWGDDGTCYVGADAQERAEEQGAAAHAAGYRDDAWVERHDLLTTLGSPKRTPEGHLIVEAVLHRSGVFEYERADGVVVREYCPPSEILDAQSIESAIGKAVTIHTHPGTMIDASNARSLSVGMIGTDPRGEVLRRDGAGSATDARVVARLVIQDAQGVAAIDRSGLRQISPGKRVQIDNTPGTTPSGERYDAVQRSIRYNHVTILKRGRQGAEVALRADAARQRNQPEEHMETTTIRIDGVDVVVASTSAGALQKVIASSAERVDLLTGERDAAQSNSTELQTKLDALVGERDALVAKFDAIDEAPRFDSAAVREYVAERNELVPLAVKLDVEHEQRNDGAVEMIDNAALRRAIVVAYTRDDSYSDSEQRSDAAVEGAYSVVKSSVAGSVHSLRQLGRSMRNDDGSPKVSDSFATRMDKARATYLGNMRTARQGE